RQGKRRRGQARKQPRDTGPGWVRFTSAKHRKAGQNSVGVDNFSGDHHWQTWWLRPGGSLWGATEDLPATLEALRGVIRARTKGGTLSSVVISPASVTDTLSKTFTRVFDMGVRAPTKKVPTALEVVLIAERVAVVSVMVALSESVRVPIGYATNDEARIRRIAELSCIGELAREGTRLWPQRGR
uniref:hypothetical protein n=1 Tax=Ralstonia solanacearum TaxID=305 RepID=UPI001E51F074